MYNLIFRTISGVIGGIPFAFFGALLIVTALIPDPDAASTWGARVFLGFWGLAIILAIASSRPAKVWRRLLIGSGLMALVSPVAALFFTSNIINVRGSDEDYTIAEAAGHAIGGGILTGMMGFVGLFLGATLIISGALIGRDKVA